MDFLRQLFDTKADGGLQMLIQNLGIAFLFLVVFAETGLLIGFFLPGDSLLFMAGLVASQGHLNLALMLFLLSIAAIAGDSVGFLIGRKAGPALFKRQDSRLFKRKHLDAAREFYEKHGPKTIVLARFVPIVRTFAPTVAGAAGMDYRQFIVFNVLGGVGWIFSMTLLGFFLGNVPFVAHNLEKAVILIVILSVLPMILHALKARKNAANPLRDEAPPLASPTDGAATAKGEPNPNAKPGLDD